MSEPQASEQRPERNPPETDLTEELGNLGKNLVGVLRAAWDRPERLKLQEEIQGGINELGSTLRKEAKAVSESPVSQRIKTEVGDLGYRVRSGQVEARVREELVGALHALNTELEKVSNILATNATSDSEGMEENPVAETPAQAVQESSTKSVEAGSKGKAKAKRQAKPKVIVEEGGAATEHAAPPPDGGTAPAEDSPEAG